MLCVQSTVYMLFCECFTLTVDKLLAFFFRHIFTAQTHTHTHKHIQFHFLYHSGKRSFVRSSYQTHCFVCDEWETNKEITCLSVFTSDIWAEIEWDSAIGKWIGMKRLAQMLHTIYLVSKRKIVFVILHPRNRNGIPEVWLKVAWAFIVAAFGWHGVFRRYHHRHQHRRSRKNALKIFILWLSVGYKTKLRNTIHATPNNIQANHFGASSYSRCIWFFCVSCYTFRCDSIECNVRSLAMVVVFDFPEMGIK